MKTLFLLFAFAALACASDLARETTPGPAVVGCRVFIVHNWKSDTQRRTTVYEMERCSDAQPMGAMFAVRYIVDSRLASIWAIRYIPTTDIEVATVQKTD